MNSDGRFAKANEIIDNLWLGDEESSRDHEFLSSKNISNILVAGHGLDKHFPDEFKYEVLKGIHMIIIKHDIHIFTYDII